MSRRASNGAPLRLVLSAGRGPAECAWAVKRLTERLERDARRHGIAVRRLEELVDPDRRGFASVLLELRAAGAGATPGEAELRRFVDGWTGTLCWRAPSPFRRGVKRKNWYVIAEQRGAAGGEAQPVVEADVVFEAVRTGGPGGQHRNKAATGVRARHVPTGVVVVAGASRSAHQNRKEAMSQIERELAARARRARDATAAAEWGVHDRIVRGNPVRTETP